MGWKVLVGSTRHAATPAIVGATRRSIALPVRRRASAMWACCLRAAVAPEEGCADRAPLPLQYPLQRTRWLSRHPVAGARALVQGALV